MIKFSQSNTVPYGFLWLYPGKVFDERQQGRGTKPGAKVFWEESGEQETVDI